MAAGRPLHLLQGLLDSDDAVAVLAPLAALYDLLAPVALWHPRPRVRRAAAAVGACFHVTNSLLFRTIHSFPFVCTAAYLLFLHPGAPPPQQQQPPPPQQQRQQPQQPLRHARLLCSGAAAAAWVAVQLLLPLRPWLQSADPSWSKLGDTFAWRMMADVSDGWVSLTLHLPGEAPSTVHPQSSGAPVLLPGHSIPLLLTSPHMLEQYVRAEADAACAAWRRRRRGAPAEACVPRVHCEAWKAVNGGPYQRWADPSFDFGAHLPGSASSGGTGTGSTGGGTGGGAGAWGWMLPRLARSAWREGAEAEARRAVEEWRRRGFVVERFAMGAKQPAFTDRILPGAYREASLVALHGTPTLALAPGAASVAVGAGEARALPIGREHVIDCGGGGDDDAPCSWLYAMR